MKILFYNNYKKNLGKNLKQGIGSKKLFLIEDIDENRIFLVYI